MSIFRNDYEGQDPWCTSITAGVLILALVLLLLSSCTSQAVLPAARDSVRIEERIRVDSVWRDRWHTEYIKGDTLFVRDSVFIDRVRAERLIDSVLIRDTIEVRVEVPTQTRSGYDRMVARGFWVLLVLILLRVAWIVLKRYTKLGL